MKLPTLGARTRLLCNGIVVLAIGTGISIPVAAQSFHGASILKQCAISKVGDTTRCNIRIENVDEFGDTITVDEAWDVIKPGTDNIRVPNTGNLPITAILAPTTCTVGGSFPCNLGPGGRVVVRSEQYVIEAGDPNPLPDQGHTIVRDTCDVAGTGGDCPFNIPNELQFSAVTNWFSPSFTVEKTGPDVAKAGDTITYTVTVTDTSTGNSAPDLACTANDSLAGPLGSVTPGVPLNYNFDIPAGTSGALDNTVTVTCSPTGFDNQINEQDSHVVDVFDPSVSVDKTGPDFAKAGDTITYAITLTNTSSGNTPALSCTADDSLLGNLGAISFGVTNVNYDVPAGTSGPLNNEVTVSCTIDGFQNVVGDSDTHIVEVFDPSVSIDKTGPDIAKSGDTITYAITLTNTSSGNTPALSCTADDSLLGNLGAISFGVTNVNFDVPADTSGPLNNEVTVSCTIDGFQNVVGDSDTHVVDVFDPGVSLDKTGPDFAKAGDTITYTLMLTNESSGNTPALDCTFDDSLGGGPFPITPGVPVDYDYTVQAGDSDPLVNTATVNCSIAGFQNQVGDEASHSVDLLDPSVELTKECRPDPITVGEDINWAVTVDNTGDTSLDCLVNDTTAGFADEPVTVAAGSSETLNASRATDLGDVPLISNTASVSCTLTGAELPNVLEDDDSADCEVVAVTEFCRTPGFWGSRAGSSHPRSTNLTQHVINEAGGSLSICGQTVDNTNVGNVHSAVEAMCVRVEGLQQRQLARQLTAAALNCVASGGGADCSGTSVATLWADANAACIANNTNLSNWIAAVDAFNNGIDRTCDETNFSELDIFDGISPLPGPAGGSEACSAANGNGWKIVPAPAGEMP